MLDLQLSPYGLLYFYTFSSLLFIACTYLTLFAASTSYERSRNGDVSPNKSAFTIEDVLILPGRVSHTRLFPKFNSFVYSYLMVGIPIHSINQGNSLISVDERSWWKRRWLRVEAKDHLERHNNEYGIRQKLGLYLHSQGVDAATYPKVYLITSPRFLNYKFSPASFWYLYSAELELKAMISEVNNTFDERRIYFLPFNTNQEGASSPKEHMSPIKGPSHPCYLPQTFKHVWPKDFHVSPFNSRKGSYSLSASGPPVLRSQHLETKANEPFVDIKATLSSSKGRPKMTVRLWSTQRPLDPAAMSILDSYKFICSWWWVGLVTYPRILVQAAKLGFLRKLSIWYRPEVKPTTLGRKATAEEIVISSIFGRYLIQQFERLDIPARIRCFPEDRYHRQWTFIARDPIPPNSDRVSCMIDALPIQLTVLTPAFYSRLVCYLTVQSVFAAEIFATEYEENQTAQTSDKGELCALLSHTWSSYSFPSSFSSSNMALQHKSQQQQQQQNSGSWLDSFAWRLVYLLRRPPTPKLYPSPALPSQRAERAQNLTPRSPDDSIVVSAEGNPGPSFLDAFVRSSCSRDEQKDYRRALLQVFLADRIALGSVGLLRCYKLMARGFLAGLFSVWVRRLISELVLQGWMWRGLIMASLCLGWGWLECYLL